MSIKFESFKGTGGGAVTGGLVYKGSYNATTSSPSLVTAKKGDFYIVSVAGALAGVTLNVGDHIVFNQDAADPVTSAMFDTIDNTDAVASVNAQTGVVVLNAANVGALAITSNLSDLNNAVTARTNLGLGTAAVKDHGTTNGDLVILDAVGLPAVDGSQLTGITATDSSKLAIANNLSDLNNAVTARTNLGLGTAAVKDHGTTNGDLVILDATGLPAVDGSQLTGVTGTDATKLAITNNLSDLNNATTARTNLGLGTAAVKNHGTTNGDLVLLDAVGLPAVDGSQLTGVTGTDATKLAIANNLSDLNNAVTARTNLGLGTAAVKNHGTTNGDLVLLDAVGLPAVDGSQLTGITATDSSKLAIANNLSDLNNAVTARTNLGLGTAAVKDHGTTNGDLVLLDAVGLPAVDGSQLTGITATDSSKLAIANNLSDLNNAVTARTNLGLGTAAVKDHGTTNGDLVLLDAVGLPAVDGSQLTGITATDSSKLAIANNLSDLNNAVTARTNLGLGTAAVKDHGTSNGNLVLLDAVGLPAVNGSQLTGITSTDATKLAIANNLSDLNNAVTARTNLGLGTAAVKNHGTTNGDLVLLDAVGLPAVNGSQLTGLTTNIVEDTSPQLGGSLDVNGQDIVSVSNGAIELAPDGTGKVTIKGNATSGSGQIVLNCEQNSHGISLKGPPHSAAASYTLTFPNTDGNADQVLKSDGSGNLDWVDQASGGGGLTYQARTTASHSPLTPAADYHYSINADSATFVVNLPALSSLTDGQQIRFKLQARGNAAYDVTINRAGSDTIDGATSQTLSVTYSSITLVVGSTEWEIV